MENNNALILSGGMDSTSIAWWLRPRVAITIDYGQKAAKAEIEASTQLCKMLGIEHHILYVDCKKPGSGDMAGTTSNEHSPATDWWPYRNQLLITLAAMKAITLDIKKLYIGTVKSDEIHRDGTPCFIKKISELLQLQEGSLELEAPALTLSTLELIKKSAIPLDVLLLSHSCHKDVVPCNNCRGCNKYSEILESLI